MFNHASLHVLISRESKRRNIPLAMLVRETLTAAAKHELTLISEDRLRTHWPLIFVQLARSAECQSAWRWWHNPPWSELKTVMVDSAAYTQWLDAALVKMDSATTPKSVVLTARDESHAIKLLAEAFRKTPNLRRDDAKALLKAKKIRFSKRGFQSRIWPDAREEAGLERTAASGRKKIRK